LSLHQDTLLDITDFKFIINQQDACLQNKSTSATKLLAVIIHSSRHNFESRSLIRETWGTVRTHKNWSISRVFLLGIGNSSENSTVQQQINREAETHSDIVLGNFVDTYRNLTYKHLMGYKWILEHCDHADFVLRSDDDVMADIFAVLNDINRIADPSNKYYCSGIAGNTPVRDPTGVANKWFVSREEYPYDWYPSFCSFGAYLTTVPVIRTIYVTAEDYSRQGQFFWIDDVYVTGILRKVHNQRNDSDRISIRNTYNRYKWSWKISNSTYKKWDQHLRFVVIHREYEEGIMNIYWNQIMDIHAIR
jgi:beta-1,3-galactosyltransferase 1